jgi:hypothetical protein
MNFTKLLYVPGMSTWASVTRIDTYVISWNTVVAKFCITNSTKFHKISNSKILYPPCPVKIHSVCIVVGYCAYANSLKTVASVVDPDPGSSAFLPPGSGSWMIFFRTPDPGSFWLWQRPRLYSWNHKKQGKSIGTGMFASHFSGRIRNPKWKNFRIRIWIWDEKCSDPDPGSGIKHPGSATLTVAHTSTKKQST